MNFRSLSIFLKNNYGIYTLLTGVSPEFRRSWRRQGTDINEWPNGGEEAEANLREAELRIVVVLGHGGEAAGVAELRRAIARRGGGSERGVRMG